MMSCIRKEPGRLPEKAEPFATELFYEALRSLKLILTYGLLI